MPKKAGPKLAVVHGEPLADLMEPPCDLGKTGAAALGVHPDVSTRSRRGGLAMLKLAAESADRAQSCRRQIDEDGEMVRAGRAADTRFAARAGRAPLRSARCCGLGLDVEPVKGIGRPPGS